MSDDTPQVRVDMVEAIVTLHKLVHLTGVGHTILTPRKVVDRE